MIKITESRKNRQWENVKYKEEKNLKKKWNGNKEIK